MHAIGAGEGMAPSISRGRARRHRPEKVDVFFCGPPGLAAKLRPICAKLGLSFREERF